MKREILIKFGKKVRTQRTTLGLSQEELASRAGLSKFRVKKHINLKGFQNARVSDLVKYANAFNIPVANFFQVVKKSLIALFHD